MPRLPLRPPSVSRTRGPSSAGCKPLLPPRPPLTGAGEHRLSPALLSALRFRPRRLPGCARPGRRGQVLQQRLRPRVGARGPAPAPGHRLFAIRAAFRGLVADLLALPVPTVTTVTGHAAGAGCARRRPHARLPRVLPAGAGGDVAGGRTGAVGALLRRWQTQDRSGSALRARAWAFSLLAFLVMACNEHGDWRQFDRYEEYRYIVSIGLLDFVYTTLQLLRHGVRLTGGQDLEPKTGLLVDFTGDQVPLPAHSQHLCSEFCLLGVSCSIFLFPIAWNLFQSTSLGFRN
ncbi:CASP-like protein 4B4 [Zea mays]|uniref:CASP-like protein n=1 Tax=Zea mays TaxID=4577 RepID=A0A3L6FRD3_MAIZE|nr:CASP-like protein 4B4 [Zea mays]